MIARFSTTQPVARALALFLLAALAAAAARAADEPAADEPAADAAAPADVEQLEQDAFRAAVDRAGPAVLRIETVGGLERVNNVRFGTGPTSGVVVDPNGYIVSSAFNFVNRPASILVRMPDGARRPAELVATDHNCMLALLKVKVDQPLAVAEIAPQAEMRVGQWAIAVGRTFDADRPSMSVGILSAVGRIWGKALQTDAAVSPNNYGGALIDVRGRLLGIVVPLSPQSDEEVAGVEWYDSGIGFAIPAEHIAKLLPRLKKGEDLYPGVMGVGLGGNIYTGEPTIGACRPGSPAADAGLKSGDRIVEIDGRKVQRAAEVKEEISKHYAGDKLHIVALRDKDRIEADVELVARLAPYQHPFLGMLPMRDARSEPGVAVRWVYPDGPAAAVGVEPGDVLVALDGKPIADRAGLAELLRDMKPDQEAELEIRRGDQSRKLTVKLGTLPEALPPAELPPARAEPKPAEGQPKPGEGERPQVGVVPLKIPEMKNDAFAYVPQAYDPAVPHGVVVWLHAPGGVEQGALLARWKPLCDAYDLILVAPKAEDPSKWQPREVTLVGRLLQDVKSSYNVDPTRVVIHGHEGGGTMAYLAAAAFSDLVRAVAAVDAAPAGRPPQNDPLRPLAIYVASANKSDRASAIAQGIERLREAKVPVTVKDLGDDPRYLNPDELAELVRWVDMLDRI